MQWAEICLEVVGQSDLQILKSGLARWANLRVEQGTKNKKVFEEMARLLPEEVDEVRCVISPKTYLATLLTTLLEWGWTREEILLKMSWIKNEKTIYVELKNKGKKEKHFLHYYLDDNPS